jgi:murein hydrolase activator
MTTENISFLEGQLSFLKMHYAKYIASVYKFGRVYDLETILSSKSINQLYIRIAYLKKFADQRRKDLQRITDRKELLERERLVLQESLLKERRIIAEKKTEQLVLKNRTEQRKEALHEIRADKSTFQKELIRKTKAAEQLANLITDLIEKERIRKEHEAKLARERAAEREKTKVKIEMPPVFEPGVPFARKEGKLPWPVTSGVVVAQFGNQVHPVLKTVTQNTGIEISVPNGTAVRAVADAEVAMIHWLPSYGNLVILNHSDGYRTVYAHLSDIEVSEGQQVKEGSVIAKSGDSVSGSVLHFELWKEKEKQNPESWLARRRR